MEYSRPIMNECESDWKKDLSRASHGKYYLRGTLKSKVWFEMDNVGPMYAK